MIAAGFAEKMERRADSIANAMMQMSEGWRSEVRGRTNVKPWYSARSLINATADVVLLGVNPAGYPNNPPADSDIATYQSNLECQDFNAHLDETWNSSAPGTSPLQMAVRRVFGTLYADDNGDTVIRRTACFNVCPLRTPKARYIPDEIWDESVGWCLDVLEHLKPKRIICFAIFRKDGMPAIKSPWHAIGNSYQIERSYSANVRQVSDTWPAFVLAGQVTAGTLTGCEIIGIPHLSHHRANELMFSALEDYLEKR